MLCKPCASGRKRRAICALLPSRLWTTKARRLLFSRPPLMWFTFLRTTRGWFMAIHCWRGPAGTRTRESGMAGPYLAFGVGFDIGFVGAFGWGWGQWGFDWRRRYPIYNHGRYFSRSNTFYNRNSYYRGGGARGVARDVQHGVGVARVGNAGRLGEESRNPGESRGPGEFQRSRRIQGNRRIQRHGRIQGRRRIQRCRRIQRSRGGLGASSQRRVLSRGVLRRLEDTPTRAARAALARAVSAAPLAAMNMEETREGFSSRGSASFGGGGAAPRGGGGGRAIIELALLPLAGTAFDMERCLMQRTHLNIDRWYSATVS